MKQMKSSDLYKRHESMDSPNYRILERKFENAGIYGDLRFAPIVFIAFESSGVPANSAYANLYIKTGNVKKAGANLRQICSILLHDFLKSLNYIIFSLLPKTKNASRFAPVDFIRLKSVFVVKNRCSSTMHSGVRENASVNSRNNMIYRPGY